MTTDVLSPNTKSVQPLKKRKIEITDIYNDDLRNNVQMSQETYKIIESANKENEETLTHNVFVKGAPYEEDTDDEDFQAINNNQNMQIENVNTTENDKNKDTLTNGRQSSLISIRKIEDLRLTPRKHIESNESIDIKYVKIENINSPEIFNSSDAHSTEWHSRNIKVLQETPTSCKKQKHLNENNSPTKRKKRKLSDFDDYDQLPDMLKSELCDSSLNEMEPIDMLHDLNSVIDFEDTKISSDFLSSTANDNEQFEQHMYVSKDPQVDPLYIACNDAQDVTDENADDKNISRNTRSKVKLEQSNTTKRNSKSIGRTESTNGTVDEATLKGILEELGILSDSESEESEISEDIIKRLYDLEIHLVHKVPPQHKVEHTAGSKSLTKEQKQSFLSYGPMKKGVYSPNEDKIIKKNWKTFCKIHKWNPKDVEPFRKMKNGKQFYMRSKGQRQKFIQFLANGLPWRPLNSVHQRFKTLYGKYEKSFKRYTSREDEEIISYMKNKRGSQKNPHKFSDLAKILGRTKHSIWMRYQLLNRMQKSQTEEPLSEVKWTLPLIGEFIKTLMDVTLSETMGDLKDAIMPKPVWLKLEEKLNIDHNVLKVFWIHQLHMQLFCPTPIYLNDIKIKLIEYIYGKGISNTREIIWPNVVKYFEGVTTVFLCKVFFYLVQEATVKIGTKYFPAVVEYLYNEKVRDIRNESTDKFLPRLFYHKGKIKIMEEDERNTFDTE